MFSLVSLVPGLESVSSNFLRSIYTCFLGYEIILGLHNILFASCHIICRSAFTVCCPHYPWSYVSFWILKIYPSLVFICYQVIPNSYLWFKTLLIYNFVCLNVFLKSVMAASVLHVTLYSLNLFLVAKKMHQRAS